MANEPSSHGLSQPRVAGFDVARSLAIFGMMIVHFTLVMTDGTPPEKWSDMMRQILDGRPATTFMILAGMSVTLLASQRAGSGADEDHHRVGNIFRWRGLLLLAFGFINLIIWEGDILRIYGVSLLLVPWLLWRSSRTLLLTLLDYDRNWDWTTMTYHRLWTPVGLMRNLFYDGFRSVIPWTGLVLFGMWLGRLDWSTGRVPRQAIAWGLALVLASTALSSLLLAGWVIIPSRTWTNKPPMPRSV